MILVVFAALCLLSVPVTGGHLGRLAHVQLRGLWLAAGAIGLQLVITVFVTHGSHSLHAAAHIVSYLLAGAFLWANRGLPGVLLIGAGAGLNALAIFVNHGIMPASATAERLAGLKLGTGFNNSAPVAHAHLAFLGDIIPFPGPAPLHNVLSVGDCLLYAGMLVLLHRVCRRPAPVLATEAEAAVQPPRVAAPAPALVTASVTTGPAIRSRPRPSRRRSGAGVLAPVGVGLAAFVVVVGVGSALTARRG